MKQYELMVIVDPEIGTDAIKKRLSEVKKLISDQKGEIFFEDIWELRDLAYKINKRSQGYYAVYDLNMDGTALKEIEHILTLENEILRHMFITLPAGYEPKTYKGAEEAAKAAYKAKKEEKEAAEKAKRAPKKVEKPAPKDTPAAAPAKAKADEPVVEKAKVEASKEVVAEKPAEPVAVAPAKEAKVEDKKEDKQKAEASLEEVDKKLSDILDNPDLNF